MAHYDPMTDTIHGCKENTYSWYHENRHRQQYQHGVAKVIDALHTVWYNIAFVTAIEGYFIWGWRGMIIGIGFAMFPHILGLFLLEADAHIAAIYQWLKHGTRN